MTSAPPRDRSFVFSRPVLVAAVAAGATVLVVVTGAMARTHDVAAVERSIGRWAYDLPGWTTPVWRTVMLAGVLWISLLVAALLALRHRRVALLLLATSLVTWTLSDQLKEAAGRGRPTLELLGRAPRDHVGNNGWPSTHSAVAAALATALLLSLPLRRWQQVLLVILAVGTAVARLHLAVHWTLDVVGGASLGVAAACLVALLARARP